VVFWRKRCDGRGSDESSIQWIIGRFEIRTSESRSTLVVLIHGGGPWHEIAAYLALKPNVWVDISSMAFVYPTREFARILRTHLTFVPQKVLFGTDAGGSPGVPNDDVHHILLSRATRDALYLALAGLVQDGVVTEAQALEMGRGVIRGNARRLYGWK
jgi:predicted TIM-barrel fold metal-dependent hydrolase